MLLLVGSEENEAPSWQSRMTWACCKNLALSQHENQERSKEIRLQPLTCVEASERSELYQKTRIHFYTLTWVYLKMNHGILKEENPFDQYHLQVHIVHKVKL